MQDKIEMACPECGAKMRVSLDEIAQERTVRCPRGHSVKLQDEGHGVRKVTKALKDLEKTIKRLGKR